jgi:hypothetical protein
MFVFNCDLFPEGLRAPKSRSYARQALIEIPTARSAAKLMGFNSEVGLLDTYAVVFDCSNKAIFGS